MLLESTSNRDDLFNEPAAFLMPRGLLGAELEPMDDAGKTLNRLIASPTHPTKLHANRTADGARCQRTRDANGSAWRQLLEGFD